MTKKFLRPAHRTRDGMVTMYRGDCRKVMPRLHAEGYRAKFVFADPPFNLGRAYDQWNDSLPPVDYVKFTYEWLGMAVRLLTDDGAIVINCFDNIAAEIVCSLKTRGLHLSRWVIWHYRFGECQSGNMIQSKQHVLYFVKDPKNFTREMSRVLEPSDRASKYNDPRTMKKKKNGVPGMRVPFDVWQGSGFVRIQGNNKERRRMHDNQLPERYARRLISMLTNPGDEMLDCFGGSGTFGTIGYAEGRRVRVIELSRRYVRGSWQRITKKGPATPKDWK